MQRGASFKISTVRIPLRKSAAVGPRRGYPAWIDAGEPGVVFAAKKPVITRVRDGLVLRSVGRTKKAAALRRNAHGASAR